MPEKPLHGASENNRSIIIIGALFFIFGFVTWLGSVLIPYLKIACELNTFASYFVAFAFYISYALMALPAGWVLQKTGFKKGMMLGLLLMAVGALLFIPAAYARLYPVFLLGLFIQGAGLTILQTASNPYIVLLGAPESAAKRISVMGICNGIAGVTAPLILGSIILQDADHLQQSLGGLSAAAKTTELQVLANRVIVPYTVIALLLVIMAVWIYKSGLPEVDADPETAGDEGDTTIEARSIFQFPHLLMGVLTLFLYVGVEVIAVDTITSYAASIGISLSTARFFASFTIFNMLLGYLIGIICVPRFIQQEKALQISAIAGIVFALVALSSSGIVSVIFIGFLGLANALCWPSIWPLAINGLGRFTKQGSSLLIMAIGGGAILPLLYGRLAENYSPQQAYWLVIPGYCCILFYAIKGHRWKAGKA